MVDWPFHPKPQTRPKTIAEAFEGITDRGDAPSMSPGYHEAWHRARPGDCVGTRQDTEKLDSRKPSKTLTKSEGYGGAYHPTEPRPISTLERKRIGSFPDGFRFTEWKKAVTQIGNSVPPNLMRAIAENIKEAPFMEGITDPTVVSTFAGCGGSSLGYKLAGYRELLAVEWDNNAVETFRLNFPEVPVYHGDIAALTGAECMRLAGIGPGELDVLDGSPPCQGFSTAGKRKFDDPRNSLFMEYARLVDELQPKVFVMENVTGMVKGVMKQAYLQIVKTLRACGYQVKGQVMNSMYYNVPQSRERVIIIGVRNDIGIGPSHPKPQTRPVGPKQEIDASEKWLTDKEAQQARAHKARHEARGNGFGWVRLSESKPSPTWPKTQILQTSPLWEYSSNRLRAPSAVEMKRIGSYPDEFKFTSYDAAWERIGNSVPPNLMRAIAEHIKTHILEKVVAV